MSDGLHAKRLLAALALGLVPGLMGVDSALAQQTPKDVLVVGHVAKLETLDPPQSVTISDVRILVNLYDGLLRYKKESLDFEPSLATSWTVSDDGLTYTFKLREGVTFPDGSKFNAEAVKFNFDRVFDENHPYHDTGPFPFASLLGPVTSTEAPADDTFVLHLAEPYAPALTMIAGQSGFLASISPAAVKEFGKDFARHGGGVGPFAVSLWESNQRIVLDRNDNYWGAKPRLRQIVFRPIVDENARISEMLTGGIDLTVEVPPDNVANFVNDSRFKFYEQEGPHIWYVLINTVEPPFNDKRMRQALNYAINKKAMVDDILRGTATIANGPIPAAFSWAYNNSLQPYPYDPGKARELMAAAGYGDGVDISFFVTESGSGMLSPLIMGTAIQADLAAVGINAKIETFEWNTFLGKIIPGLKGVTDIAELSFMTQDPDMHPFLALRTGAPVNSGAYSNPEVDKLIDAGRAELDQGKRAVIYKKMQELVYDDAPWVFIANWKQNAVASARVKNFKLHPSFTLPLSEVYKE